MKNNQYNVNSMRSTKQKLYSQQFNNVAVAELDAGRVVRIMRHGGVVYITSKEGEITGKRLPVHHKVCQLVEPLMLTVGTLIPRSR